MLLVGGSRPCMGPCSAGQWYGARFSTLSVATGGIRVIGVLLKEVFDAYLQVSPFQGPVS